MICKLCNQEKTEEEMKYDKRRGVTNVCKECSNKGARESYKRRAESVRNGVKKEHPKNKKCKKCGIVLDISEYGYNKIIDRYEIVCKKCKKCQKAKKPMTEKEKLELEGKRKCKKCNTVYPLEMFPSKYMKYECITCNGIYNQERKEKYKESSLLSGRKRYAQIKDTEAFKEKVKQYSATAYQKNKEQLLAKQKEKRVLQRDAKKIAWHEKIEYNKSLLEKGLKKCSMCGCIKNITDFTSILNTGRYSSYCKDCINSKKRNENKEKALSTTHFCSICGIEIPYNKKKYCENCLQKKKRDKEARRRKNKYHTDKEYHFIHHMRKTISRQLKENKGIKINATAQYIGCSYAFLKNRITALFKEGMTWDNYGINGWHIDHHIPISWFDLTDIRQVAICFHYKNLYPLWGEENIKKGGTLPEDWKTVLRDIVKSTSYKNIEYTEKGIVLLQQPLLL